MAKKKKKKVNIEHYTHDAKRKNNPPAKMVGEGNVPKVDKAKYAYSPHLGPVLRFDSTGKSDVIEELLANAKERPLSSTELETLRLATSQHQPWLEWTGKQEEHDRGLFEVDPVALHIHERISANAIMHSARRKDVERSLFADPEMDYKEAVQFYQHDMNWANRLILGDSLQVMSSLAQRENMTGKVQMIYMDPPYGIKFGSNFMPKIGEKDVKDIPKDLTREVEMVKAYRDTWSLGLHSYLSYLKERLHLAKDLLTEEGSIFLQISDVNLHRVKQIMDEVFGSDNFFATIPFKTTSGLGSNKLKSICDYLLWYTKSDKPYFQRLFYKQSTDDFLYLESTEGALYTKSNIPEEDSDFRKLASSDLVSSGSTTTCIYDYTFEGVTYSPGRSRSWKTNKEGMKRLDIANRLIATGNTLRFKTYDDDFPVSEISNMWTDTIGELKKSYVVQTSRNIIQRCMLMTTKPGDLILDPTCGSGTAAYVAEQWGRRWITIDTSRVSISIARQRLLTSNYYYYKTKVAVSPGDCNKLDDFIYRSVPHLKLSNIAQNINLEELVIAKQLSLDLCLNKINDAIAKVKADLRLKLVHKLAEKMQINGLRSVTQADVKRLLLPNTSEDNIFIAFKNKSKIKPKHFKEYISLIPLSSKFEHWQVPFDTDPDWPQELQDAVIAYRKAWREKMAEVNACIAANAEQEVLVDQPEVVPNVVRVSGPFTVEGVMPAELSLLEEGLFAGGPESLIDEDGNGIPDIIDNSPEMQNTHAYLEGMCKHIKKDGVKFLNNQQQQFARLDALFGDGSGSPIHAEAVWKTGEASGQENEATVAIAFGPQYGPVTAVQVEDLIHAARGNGYEELVVAGFSFDPESTAIMSELTAGKLQVHLAHIRPDINPGMDGLLKDTANSELFTVFGLPDVSLEKTDDEYQVTLDGVSIYDPIKSVVYATKSEKVAAWFLDSDYDGRCFCITQAFFPDQDAWGKLAKALKDVIEPDDFAAFKGTTSLPFEEGKYKKIAVKVIDPRGNEVMVVKRLSEVTDG